MNLYRKSGVWVSVQMALMAVSSAAFADAQALFQDPVVRSVIQGVTQKYGIRCQNSFDPSQTFESCSGSGRCQFQAASFCAFPMTNSSIQIRVEFQGSRMDSSFEVEQVQIQRLR